MSFDYQIFFMDGMTVNEVITRMKIIHSLFL